MRVHCILSIVFEGALICSFHLFVYPLLPSLFLFFMAKTTTKSSHFVWHFTLHGPRNCCNMTITSPVRCSVSVGHKDVQPQVTVLSATSLIQENLCHVHGSRTVLIPWARGVHKRCCFSGDLRRLYNVECRSILSDQNRGDRNKSPSGS